MSAEQGPIEDFWAVVPAGGAGTRLWPLSRRDAPKFLHDLTGSGRTLVQETCERLRPLADDRVVVVTGAAHAQRVVEQVPWLDPALVLAEPSPRDSMPAIAWAAAVVARADPDAVIGSFAADQVIVPTARFHEAVREAVAVARTGLLVTIGVAPTHPATGFGYIRVGEPLAVAGAPSASAVAEFVEKPDRATAERYLAEGGYRWNAGMFVVRAAVLLDLLRDLHPELAAGVQAIAADPGRLPEVWPTLTRIAIDHAVAEPAAARGRVAVVPATFRWDDVGDFDALAGLAPAQSHVGAGAGPRSGAGGCEVGGASSGTEPGAVSAAVSPSRPAAGEAAPKAGPDAGAGSGEPTGVRVLGRVQDVLDLNATGLVVAASGRLVAVVGVEDLVVVDTPDVVLVVPRARAQEVKAVVDRLTGLGRDDLR